MTKEQFEKAVADRRSHIGQIESEIADLEKNYVSERAIPNGTHVRIITGWRKGKHGFVASSRVAYRGAIGYVLFEKKKDGTPSARTMGYRFDGGEIEVAS